MIIDLQALYRIAEEETHGKITFDNYSLKEGIYLKLNANVSLEQNQREQKERLLVVKKKEETTPEQFELRDWFQPRDFYSNAISANKFVDTVTKKMHNTNFLTLFMKLDTFIADDPQAAKKEKKEKFLLENEWEAYIKTFYSEKLKAADHKMNQLSGYPELIRWIESNERKRMKQELLNFLIDNKSVLIKWITEIKEQTAVKNYLKIFFEADEAIYERESRIYLYPSIFLKNDFNIAVDDEIYGMPSYNIGLNDKKPFLKMLTKKSQVPLLVSPEDAVLRKNLFSWLGHQSPFIANQVLERQMFSAEDTQKLNETIHFMIDGNGVIDYYEKTPFSRTDQLEKPFFLNNIIKAYEWKADAKRYILAQDREPIRKPDVLLDLTSRCFFKNYLHKKNMLFNEPKIASGVFPGELLNLFLSSRQAFYDFFVKGTDVTLRAMINFLSQQSIEIQLLKTTAGSNIISLGQAFNLRLGWLLYFDISGSGEKVQKLTDFVTHLKAKFNQKQVVDIDSSEEYFFLAGQVGSYLLSLSETSNKNYGMFEGILKAKKSEILKRQISDLFSTYEHKVSPKFYLLRNVLAALHFYKELPTLIDNNSKDYLLAGIFAQNMFYNDKKDGEAE